MSVARMTPSQVSKALRTMGRQLDALYVIQLEETVPERWTDAQREQVLEAAERVREIVQQITETLQ